MHRLNVSRKLNDIYRTSNISVAEQAKLLHEWLGFAQKGLSQQVYQWGWDSRAEHYAVFPYLSDLFRLYGTDNYQLLINRFEGALWRASFGNFRYPAELHCEAKCMDHYLYPEGNKWLSYFENSSKPKRKCIRYFAVPTDFGRKLIRKKFKGSSDFEIEFPGPWLRRYQEEYANDSMICLNLIQAACVLIVHRGVVCHGMRTRVLLPNDLLSFDIDAHMSVGRMYSYNIHTDYVSRQSMNIEALPILSYFDLNEEVKLL